MLLCGAVLSAAAAALVFAVAVVNAALVVLVEIIVCWCRLPLVSDIPKQIFFLFR